MSAADGSRDSSDYSNLSEQQEVIISVLTVISSTLSIFGSSMIINLAWTNPRQTPYRRILLGLSISDVMASIMLAASPFLVPKYPGSRVWAIGNDTTCSVHGFFAQGSFSTVWYSGYLSLYYLMTVRYGIKNADFARKYEIFIHISAVSYSWIASIIGISIGLFSENALGVGCWVAEYPENCEEDDSCVGQFYGWIFAGVPTFLWFVFISVSNFMIYTHVRSTINKPSNTMTDEKKKRIAQLANQGFFYVFCFFMSYGWAFVVKVAESLNYSKENEADIFFLLVLQSLFLPAQGFMNLLVYTRPNYLRVRDEYPQETRWWAVRKSWFGSIAPIRTTDVDGASLPPVKNKNKGKFMMGMRSSRKKSSSKRNQNSGDIEKYSESKTAAAITAAAAKQQQHQERRQKVAEGFSQEIAKVETALGFGSGSHTQTHLPSHHRTQTNTNSHTMLHTDSSNGGQRNSQVQIHAEPVFMHPSARPVPRPMHAPKGAVRGILRQSRDHSRPRVQEELTREDSMERFQSTDDGFVSDDENGGVDDGWGGRNDRNRNRNGRGRR